MKQKTYLLDIQDLLMNMKTYIVILLRPNSFCLSINNFMKESLILYCKLECYIWDKINLRKLI